MKNFRRVALMTIVALAFLSDTANVYSCGPFFPSAVFIYHDGPDFNLNSYFSGHLGIVQPRYSAVYLYAAYRYFDGRPLSASERAILESMSPDVGTNWTPSPGYTAWTNARLEVPSANYGPNIPVQADVPSDSENYEFYININDDAFATAAQTLKERIAQFGAKSPAVADWLHAQDAVFRSVETRKVPAPADSALPAVIRKDRAYQIASAYFYMRKFSVAESLFTAIGRDTSSPWNKISRYLVARAIIRSATLGTANQDSVLRVAEGYMSGLMKDWDMKELHPAVKRLISFCMFRTDPEKLFTSAAASIEAPTIDTSFRNNWDIYLELMGSIKDSSFFARHDFADWLNNYFYGYGQSAFNHAYNRWRATKSDAWLIQALSIADTLSGRTEILLKAAEAIPTNSAAYPTATYWRIRFLISAGMNRAADKLIDQMLGSDYAPGSRTYVNLLLSERARTVDNFRDFLKYCHELPYGDYSEYDGSTTPDSDSTALFTQVASSLNTFFPLPVLTHACQSQELPSNLRAMLVRATWLRAFLLNDEKTAIGLTPLFETLTPEAKPYLDRYLAAPAGEARQFAAAYFILNFPGLEPYIVTGDYRGTPLNEIDDYHNNWWYPGDQAVEGSPGSSYNYGSGWAGDESAGGGTPPSFLTKAEVDLAKKETKELSNLPGASDYLIGIVVKWASGHTDDPRVPEALHLAVESGRFGYHGPATTRLEKKAFELLHGRYPNSTWAEKTKYYY